MKTSNSKDSKNTAKSPAKADDKKTNDTAKGSDAKTTSKSGSDSKNAKK